ncbi:MAG: hypothetical protein KAS62_09145, partial [Candidatus Delongbacteria bacterium]|nr:hypothetical protein [Candidatus Delongbacteria bacterium]
YGEFDNDLVRINGDFDVTGVSTLNSDLDVVGTSTLNGNVGIGVDPNLSYGLTVLDDYRGVNSVASTTTGGYTYGVYGVASGGTTRNVSIYGASATGTGINWSGYFLGNVYVSGTVSKSSDQVKIDHPLEPESKFLSYSTVVSDEMMGIYNGIAILNNEGKAIVTMPDWFESANTEFRYQLTAIGVPGPNLYILKKINGNTFEIAGGEANMEVSWQVTGIRNDNFARKHPIEVETTKNSTEKGYYLHPESYGLPIEMGIEHQHEEEISK